MIILDVISIFEEFSDETLLEISRVIILGFLHLVSSLRQVLLDYIVESMVKDHVIFANTKVIDPCCGSGFSYSNNSQA